MLEVGCVHASWLTLRLHADQQSIHRNLLTLVRVESVETARSNQATNAR